MRRIGKYSMFVFLAGIAICVILVCWVLKPGKHVASKTLKAEAIVRRDNELSEEKKYKPITPDRVPPKPKLSRYTEYPPKTQNGEEMWQWWRAMNRKDPLFELRMPSDFFGLVIDQDDQPVAGVEVMVRIPGPSGYDCRKFVTPENGRFSIEGATGSTVYVEVSGIDGCFVTDESRTNRFSAVRFFENSFYVADSANPVVFRMHRIKTSEPVFVFSNEANVPIGDESDWLDVSTGKLSNTGDVCFLGVRSGSGGRPNEHNLVVRCADGVGVTSTDEKYLSTAPESGYNSELELRRIGPRRSFGGRIFLRTRDGKYAIIEVDAIDRDDYIKVTTWALYNPSGSRNLEFDYRKQINR